MGLPKTNMFAGGWPSALLLLLATPAWAEDPRVAQARSVEAEEQKALAGKSFEMASKGVLSEGSKRHEVATWRRISYPASLAFVRAQFDGQPVDEEALREKLTGNKKRRMGADLLICVLAPFTDADVSYLGPAADGGMRFYAVPHVKGKVLSVQIETDAAGHKRSATPRLGGEDFKHADKVEFTMRFAGDGGPLEYRSFTSGHFLWWSKSLEMSGRRAP
jgi:hypothetical protein